MTVKQRLFIYVCYSKGVCHCHLHFDRDSKAGRGVGDFIVAEREVFWYTLIETIGEGRLLVG